MDWKVGKFDVVQPQKLHVPKLYPEKPVDFIPALADMVLEVMHAGIWNRPLSLAVLARAEGEPTKKRDQGPARVMADEEKKLADARELFPEYVIVGWEGGLAAYSSTEADDFCSREKGLPDWLMSRLVKWCERESNFIEAPVAANAEALAKNS